jgi:hypothetical protein
MKRRLFGVFLVLFSSCSFILSAPEPVRAAPTDIANQQPTCDAGETIVLSWLICATIRVLVGSVDWIRDNVVVPFLEEKPIDVVNDKSAQGIYKIWQQFRNIASVFFILVFFLVIFGTAIGWDNYQIKKILPRLVVGALLVPLSWYICVAVVDVGYVVAQGLLAITSNIIPNADITFTSSIQKLFFGGAIVLGVAAGAGGLVAVSLGVLVSMFVAFFVVFLTLVLRKILITALIVTSPFWFLAWILPNTGKLFKEGWSNFTRLVAMYPLVILIFEAGRLFSATAATTAGNKAEVGVTPLFQIIGLTLPLFALPMTFSWAGKGLAMGSNLVGKGAGVVDKRWGKDSEMAKRRKQEREENNAMRFNNKNFNPLGSKVLGAVYRGAAARRSGLGGFTSGAAVKIPGAVPVVGGKNVGRALGMGMSAAQKVRMNTADAKAQAARAQSNAQDIMRKQDKRTTNEKIHDATDVQYEKMLEDRIKEAMVAIKDENGISVKDIGLDGAGREKLKRMVEEGARTGNDAMVGAALTRLSQSNGGFHTAQETAQGKIGKYIDQATGQTRYIGGGGWNAKVDKDGWAVDANGKKIEKYEDGVLESPAVLGGNWGRTADARWLNVWNMATKGVKAPDANKPIAAAATDLSATDVAELHSSGHERVAAYLDQGSQLDARDASGHYVNPALRDKYAVRDDSGTIDEGASAGLARNARQGANDYASSATIAAGSNILKGRITTGAQARVVEASNVPVTAQNGSTAPIIPAETAAQFANIKAVVPPEEGNVVAPAMAAAIAEATAAPGKSVNVSHVQEIQQNIVDNGGTTSPLYTTLESHYLEHGSIDPSILPAPSAPSAVPQAVSDKLAHQFKGNLAAISDAARHYERNTSMDPDDSSAPGYRDVVNQAHAAGLNFPLPPQPKPAPPATP